MKSLFTLFLWVFSVHAILAANYYTNSDGNMNAAVNWLGNSKPSGTNSVSKWSGSPFDTVFVRNAMTAPSFAINGPSMVFVIESGASLNVTGAVSMNNSALIIKNGGTLNVGTNFSTSNTSGSDIIIGGNMSVGGFVSSIAGTWNVLSTGSLAITGNFTNDTGSMDFTTNGSVTVGGNVSFHSGSYSVGSTGSFFAEGTSVTVGHATINNDGYMGFPNATGVETWSGSWDCDGSSGSGLVEFGEDIDCGLACSGGGSGNCYPNASPAPPPPPLPVTWLSVNALGTLAGVEVSWSTASEENNDYFVVERSLDAEYWLPIGKIDGAGNSNEVLNYSFLDNSTTDVVTYYRIKQVDFDGKSDYSNIVAYIPGTSKNVSEGLYPNPNEGLFYVDLGDEEIVSLSIVNPKGEQVAFYYSVLDNLVKITIDGSYAAGFYTAILVTESGVDQKNFIVK